MSSVYFLQVGFDGPIKIGFTASDVKRRIRAIQMGSPHILRWIGVFSGSRRDESEAHLLLHNSAFRAEWFHPTTEVLAFVQQKSPNFEPLVLQNVPLPLLNNKKRRGRAYTTVAVPISVLS